MITTHHRRSRTSSFCLHPGQLVLSLLLSQAHWCACSSSSTASTPGVCAAEWMGCQVGEGRSLSTTQWHQHSLLFTCFRAHSHLPRQSGQASDYLFNWTQPAAVTVAWSSYCTDLATVATWTQI